MHRDIISYRRFYTVIHIGQITSFDPFWDTWESNGDQKGSNIVHPSKNKSPEARNLHKEIISRKRFDTIPYLGQITIFDLF